MKLIGGWNYKWIIKPYGGPCNKDVCKGPTWGGFGSVVGLQKAVATAPSGRGYAPRPSPGDATANANLGTPEACCSTAVSILPSDPMIPERSDEPDFGWPVVRKSLSAIQFWWQKSLPPIGSLCRSKPGRRRLEAYRWRRTALQYRGVTLKLLRGRQ